MAFIQEQSHQVNWRLLESVNKILWRFPLNLLWSWLKHKLQKDELFKNLLKKWGAFPISAVHVILDNIASSFKVILDNWQISLFEFKLFENHSSIWLTSLNRPTILSLILKHWVPSRVENGIKWVNRKIGVHVGRPKWTLVTTWVRVPTWVGTYTYILSDQGIQCILMANHVKLNLIFGGSYVIVESHSIPGGGGLGCPCLL